ncbi:MAG TPA: ion channel, partial [Paludibacter sp.]|nr:ion channel [Paludibacter sp.]
MIGYFGFIYLEGYSPLESVYMILTTFLMIGYGEIQPLSETGRIFNLALIISGFSVGLYAIGKLSTFFIEGEFSKLLKIRKMNKQLSNLKDHYIVCGYGKTGKIVIDELLKQRLKVVLIEGDL